MLEISNHGPLIVSSNYWESEASAEGKFFVSPNGGAIRILVPGCHRNIIEECRTSKYAVLSRGPWPAMKADEALEILFEDGTDSPFALQFTPESCAMLPAEPDPGREWTVALWDLKKGKPHKALERICHWRRVAAIPCLEPWKP